jgi:hypothetical protein
MDQASAQLMARRSSLSSYLFILAIDTLHFILQWATDQGLITLLRDRMARLHLSMYADDAVVFLNPVKVDVDMSVKARWP